jgi:hypothetical protein
LPASRPQFKKFNTTKNLELTLEEKQLELKRHRDILIATVDYYIERYNYTKSEYGDLNLIPLYEKIKCETEEHFQKGRLTRLKQYLRDMTEEPREAKDFKYGKYIKETTGYDIDIFDTFKKRIEKIVERKSIKNEDEYRDVLSTIDYLCQSNIVDQNKIDILSNILIDFDDKISGTKTSKIKRKSKKAEKYFSNELSLSISPDNKRRLVLAENGTDENYCSTQVTIGFENSGAGVYAANGMNLSIKTYWKDNNTIVVETKKNYQVLQKWEQVQNFKDVIKVEYIET